jgi:membrane protease YdiL (CAAX protease family)
MAVVVIGLARRRGLDWATMGLQPSGILRGLGVGLAAGLVALALALAVWGFEDAFRSDDVLDDSTVERWFVPLVRIPLGTAVFEEVLFRSVLLGIWLARGSTRSAMWRSSVLFGLWHIVPAWESAGGTGLEVASGVVGTVLITALAGVLFALQRLWSTSVLAPIFAHWATNSLAALVALDLV